MSMEEIQHAAATLGKEGDLMGVFLMTREHNDLNYIIEGVETTRASLPAHSQVWVNRRIPHQGRRFIISKI